MAGIPILENSAHSPELVSGYPRDNVVIAVLEPLCCHGEAAVCEQSGCAHHIMERFPPRAAVFSMEQVTFYRSLLCSLRGIILCRFRLRTVWETFQEAVSVEHTPTDMCNPHVNRN